MLPSDLLRVRISRDKIRPLYVAIDANSISLAERLTKAYTQGLGGRKEELLNKLRELEDEGNDFKLVRGLSTLLERRSTFEVESQLNPVEARVAVFEEASRVRASSAADRSEVLLRISNEMGVSPAELEKSLFSDVEDELLERDFKPFSSPEAFLRCYNLSLTQTLLFKSLRIEFSASGNWKNIFRKVKWLGLIYSVEKEGQSGEGRFRVSLDGPLSLFKMTERYGTSIAKLLPQIIAAGTWDIRAEILARNRGGKVYVFDARSDELTDLLRDARGDNDDDYYSGGVRTAAIRRSTPSSSTTVAPAKAVAPHRPDEPLYDSAAEERFSKSFQSYGTGWRLRREPEPLVAGTQVLIPDFILEKDGMKVYLEIVGFWTPGYLERKVAKLNQVAGEVDMIIAADENLACSKLERLKTRAHVIYYKNKVPLKPVIDHLKEKEALMISDQATKLSGGSEIIDTIRGEVVSIDEIAAQKGVATASLRLALRDFAPEGYVRVGDSFISTSKLDEIDQRLRGVEKLTDALRVIEEAGVREAEGGKVLESLGYTSIWEGMDMDNVRISKTASRTGTVVAGEPRPSRTPDQGGIH